MPQSHDAGAPVRDETADDGARVGYIELFFDLVFVFAITQISHYLIKHFDAAGLAQGMILFGAVWWAWIYTTWVTNWLDPERSAVRIMLAVIMLGSLIMSTAIPKAFAEGWSGLAFAGAYVLIQIGRTAYASRALSQARDVRARSLLRTLVWFMLSAPLWLWGGWQGDATLRAILWAGALAIEFSASLLLYRLPGLGASRFEDWQITGSHMAERCALFIIIALGEGIIVSGSQFVALETTPARVVALVTAFLSSFAMWWVYFDVGAKRGAEHIEEHDAPGRVGRDAFTFLHIPIVAGIVLIAVGDEISLAHPGEPVDAPLIVALALGSALFLGGTMAFKRISSRQPWFPLSHIAGLVLLVPLFGAAWLMRPTTLAVAIGLVTLFGIVAVWEWASFNDGLIERMERRNWRLGRRLRAISDRRIARRAEHAGAMAPKKASEGP